MAEQAVGGHDLKPFAVVWETTRACDIACLHCRAASQPKRSSFELTTDEGRELLNQIAEIGPRLLILSGGDPLKRPDIYDLVAHAADRGLAPSLTPSPSALIDRAAIDRLKAARIDRLAFAIDGSTAALHDGIRGVAGSFDITLRAMADARAAGVPVQVNTMISRANVGNVERIAELLATLRITRWNVFFLVPAGRVKAGQMITAEEAEKLFGVLYQIRAIAPFGIATLEAAQYRRYILQQRMKERGVSLEQIVDRGRGVIDPAALEQYVGETTDTEAPREYVYISHTGEVYPSGFLPVAAGNVHYSKLRDIYRESLLFTTLRDTRRLVGKCGACEFRELCGGSRARAYATTRNVYESEPLCTYKPLALRA